MYARVSTFEFELSSVWLRQKKVANSNLKKQMWRCVVTSFSISASVIHEFISELARSCSIPKKEKPKMGVLEVHWLAVELREWFARSRSSYRRHVTTGRSICSGKKPGRARMKKCLRGCSISVDATYARSKDIAIGGFGEPPPQLKSWLFHNGRSLMEGSPKRKNFNVLSKPCKVQLVGACRKENPISVQLVVPSSAPACPISWQRPPIVDPISRLTFSN